jgi:hypothetical protein
MSAFLEALGRLAANYRVTVSPADLDQPRDVAELGVGDADRKLLVHLPRIYWDYRGKCWRSERPVGAGEQRRAAVLLDQFVYDPAFSAVSAGAGDTGDHGEHGLAEPFVAHDGVLGTPPPGFWGGLLGAQHTGLDAVEDVSGEGYRLVELDHKVRQHVRGHSLKRGDTAVEARELFIGHRLFLRLKAAIKAAFGRRVQ